MYARNPAETLPSRPLAGSWRQADLSTERHPIDTLDRGCTLLRMHALFSSADPAKSMLVLLTCASCTIQSALRGNLHAGMMATPTQAEVGLISYTGHALGVISGRTALARLHMREPRL